MSGITERRRIGRPTLDEAATLREAFLNQAFVMLCERGVHGFSIDALAKASGVTKRTIYRQYETKAVLIEAVVEREIGRLTDIEDFLDDASFPSLDRLRSWTKRLFEYLSRSQTQRLGLLLRVASLSEVWAADMLGIWTMRLLESARVLVVSAQDSSELRAGDPEVLVLLLLDLIDGVFNRIRYNVTSFAAITDMAMDRQFEQRWHAFLHLARPDWIEVAPAKPGKHDIA